MEKLDLTKLSKATTKKFKNALKLVIKDKDTLHPNLRGVYFKNDTTINKQYIIGSNGKVAIVYIIDDMPIEFYDKVINKNGEVISDIYPTLQVPSEFTDIIDLDKNILKTLYEQATSEIKEIGINTKIELVTIPIGEGIEIDYNYYKDFMKMLDMVGTYNLYYNKSWGTIAISYTNDKSILGLILNNLKI